MALSFIISEINEILVENRDFSSPPAFDAPPPIRGGGVLSEYCCKVWCGKARIVWLSACKKFDYIFSRFGV